MRHEKQYQKRGRILVLYFLFICLVIPGPVFHAEESFPEETTKVLTEESLAEESSTTEESTEEELPDEEAQIEEPEEELPEENAVEEEQTEEEPAEEEPQEEAPATETQLIEVASAEEAAAALAELSEEDTDSRLVVFGDTLPEDTGASSVIYYEEYDEYILQFDSAEAAAEAQETLAETHDVYEDDVLTLNNLADNGMGNPDSYTWGTTAMGVDAYRDGSLDLSDTVTVAVIDTGVDPTNPFFPAGVIRSDSRDMTVSEERALADADIEKGHGTHVCGIIADMTPDAVQIMALRVYNDEGKTSWSCILTAFQYCLEHDVDVINLSLGEYNTATAPLDAVLQQAVAQDVVVVCAAGNDGRSPMYPSSLDTTIAVSAIDSTNQIWSSSNYGQAIDFCAPGKSIKSAGRSTSEISIVTKTGTSMAAPHIAAAFAYLKLADPDASWDALYEEAKARSIDLGSTGWDEEYGWGYPQLEGLFTDINTCTVELSQTSYVYNTEEKEPDVSVLYEGVPLAEGRDYTVSYENNIDAGTASATITGKNHFFGAVKQEFTIQPVTMDDCVVELEQTSCVYNAMEQRPKVIVSYEGNVLIQGSDFTVAYADNTSVGEATASILGQANCTGTASLSFEILPTPLEDCTVKLNPTSPIYSGSELKPTVTVQYQGGTLVPVVDYTVSYDHNIEIGTATATITGTGNTVGTITHTFKIVPIPMKNCKASLSQTSYTYTGKAKKPTATVKYNGKTLVKNVDYTVAYKNNKAIGKATVTITGKGNYSGSITKTFKILPAKVTQKTPVAGTKKVTVRYATVKGGCRYQIAYRIKGTSTWKKVNTTLTTAKTIKKLKSGKKYQIKVRAYKKVDGKAYIGPWSDIKTVKVK